MNLFIGSRIEDNKPRETDVIKVGIILPKLTYLINKPLFVIQPGIAVIACHDG